MLTQTAKISAEEFHHIEEPGRVRLELVNGELVVSPSPGSFHSHAVIGLIAILRSHVKKHDLGRLFTELNTEFGPLDVRRPDVMFVTKGQLRKLALNSPASADEVELIVEVISPSSGRTDREIKFQQYAEAGIRYYWMVDPHRHTFEAYELVGKFYHLQLRASGDAVVRAKPFEGLEIPLQELWW